MSLIRKLGIGNHDLFFVFLALVFVKFLFVRTLLFGNIGFFHTFLVEAGYLLFIFGLVELLPSQGLRNALYLTLNLIFSIILLSVLLYYNYYGYIATFHVLSQVGQVGAVKDSVLQLIEPIYFLLFADFILLVLFYFLKTKQQMERNMRFVFGVILFGVGLVSYNLFTQKDTYIASTVHAAENQGILTYEILASKSKKAKELSATEQEGLPDKIRTIKNIAPLPYKMREHAGIARNKNIIAIQAEALQNFVIHLKVSGKEITPFLNDMVKDNLYFSNMYQLISQGNTSDAEFIFNTSLYPSTLSATFKTYGDRKIPSFPRLLKKEGYQTLTFHTNEVAFWNRVEMYPALGFDKYYDVEFFGEKDVIGMGPSDEYLFEKSVPVLQKLQNNGQKFFAHFVTLSSHHPFKIPDEKNRIELPKRFQDTFVGDYLKSIHYLDASLKQLVQMLKKEDMWEDTIFVIYGDHFGIQSKGLKESEFPLVEELVGHEFTFLDQYHVPFIVAIGGEKVKGKYDVVASQLDILPTVANMIGLSLNDYVHFGQDIVNYPDNLFGMRYYMPEGSFFNQEIVFQPAKGFEDGKAFHVHTGKAVSDFSSYKNDYHRIQELINLSDNYLNSLPQRNQMVPGTE